ncbi:MAG: A/G-specific adenine glycosylase [Bacteroidales bacterium]|nr:A/G-specific adenine glycosylase [Bacteroidales bacterium]
MKFSEQIIKWYRYNSRDLPWRKTSDPYLIWISEVVLQQTRVDQGLAYYNRLVERFPNVHLLAAASEDELLKLWQGLGYYTRARNMHAAARKIVSEHGGNFPATYEEIIKLPGIGEYTASAIASFAFNLSHPVVDGNVMRVLSRFLGIDTPINTTEGKKQLSAYAHKFINRENPGEHNQAIMEFGALHCTPRNPLCDKCPLKYECRAFQTDKVNDLPVKLKTRSQQERYFHYLVVRINNASGPEVILRKRSEKGIWKNLYDFPLIEDKAFRSQQQLKETTTWKNMFSLDEIKQMKTSKVYSHQLSHQLIKARFQLIVLSGLSKQFNGYQVVKNKDVHNYPVPRLIDQFMTDYAHWLE